MMGPMTYERTKVAPWEKFTDGEWHTIRVGPEDEAREESLRQYRRHFESMRAWTRSNGYSGQLSRIGNGRILRVRLAERGRTADAVHLAPLSRADLGRSLMTALQLIEYALHLRQYGGRAPGGNETWAEFDRSAEAYLRKVRAVGGE